MGTGLVGHHIHLNAAPHNLRQHIGAVSNQAHRQRPPFAPRLFTKHQRLIQVFGDHVAVARFHSPFNSAAIHINGQHHAVVERDGKRLRSSHAAYAAGYHQSTFESAAKVPLGQRGKGLKCPLQYALRTDINPAPRRHLAVHHQALAVQIVEVLPVGPLAHQI